MSSSIRDLYPPDPYQLLPTPKISAHAAERYALLSAVHERRVEASRSRPLTAVSRLRALVARFG